MLDFVFRPLRLALDVGARVISKPLQEPEHELTVVVDAIHRAAPATSGWSLRPKMGSRTPQRRRPASG